MGWCLRRVSVIETVACIGRLDGQLRLSCSDWKMLFIVVIAKIRRFEQIINVLQR
jgi:hypothetical protein